MEGMDPQSKVGFIPLGTHLEFEISAGGSTFSVSVGRLIRDGAGLKGDIYDAHLTRDPRIKLVVKALGRCGSGTTLLSSKIEEFESEKAMCQYVDGYEGLQGARGFCYGSGFYHLLIVIDYLETLADLEPFIHVDNPDRLFIELVDAMAVPLVSLTQVTGSPSCVGVVAHSDLSLGNVAFSPIRNTPLWMLDWGEARFVHAKGSASAPRAATPLFQAPEGRFSLTAEGDVFSGAMLCAAIAYRDSPHFPISPDNRSDVLATLLHEIAARGKDIGTLFMGALHPDFEHRLKPAQLKAQIAEIKKQKNFPEGNQYLRQVLTDATARRNEQTFLESMNHVEVKKIPSYNQQANRNLVKSLLTAHDPHFKSLLPDAQLKWTLEPHGDDSQKPDSARGVMLSEEMNDHKKVVSNSDQVSSSAVKPDQDGPTSQEAELSQVMPVSVSPMPVLDANKSTKKRQRDSFGPGSESVENGGTRHPKLFQRTKANGNATVMLEPPRKRAKTGNFSSSSAHDWNATKQALSSVGDDQLTAIITALWSNICRSWSQRHNSDPLKLRNKGKTFHARFKKYLKYHPTTFKATATFSSMRTQREFISQAVEFFMVELHNVDQINFAAEALRLAQTLELTEQPHCSKEHMEDDDDDEMQQSDSDFADADEDDDSELNEEWNESLRT